MQHQDDGSIIQRQNMGAAGSHFQSQQNFEDEQTFMVDNQSSLLSLPKHHMSSNQMYNGKVPTAPMLLKPNGIPVFDTMDSKSAKLISNINQSVNTMEETFETKSNQNVRAHSFVVGRKVSNQTTINLLTAESQPNPGEDKQNPIKVIYVKPSVAKPSSLPPSSHNRPTGYQEPPKYKVKKPEQQEPKPKQEVKVKQSLQIPAPRPKSANKPASSTVQNEGDQKRQRPLSAKAGNGKLSTLDPSLKKMAKTEATIVPPDNTKENIPFAENRMKGQFQSITKDLFKKAQDVLSQKKQEEHKRKEEIAIKKEKQRLIAEQVKHANQELVQRQKERGLTEHVDFRKLEEDAKEQQWREENRKEREHKKEIRVKRKNERDTQLGLDIIDNMAIEEHRLKVKQVMEVIAQEEEQQRERKSTKGGVIAPIPQTRPKSSGSKLVNEDLRQVQQLNSLRQVQADQNPQMNQLDQDQEREKSMILKKQREDILKEQKLRRREKELEEQLKQQQTKQKHDDNMRKLMDELAIQKKENLARQELQRKIKQESEQLKKLEKEAEKQRKSDQRRRHIPEGSPIQRQEEQYMELHDWIDEQIETATKKKKKVAIEDEQEVPRVTKVQIQKTKNEPRAHSGLDLEDVVNLKYGSGDFQSSGNQLQIPGNNELDYQEMQKFDGRQNRYGIFGDNGYSNYVEIHKRPAPVITKVKSQKEKSLSPSSKEVKLSKETVLEAFSRIQSYHDQKVKQQEQLNKSTTSNDVTQDLADGPMNIQGKERRILNLIHKEYAKNFEQAPMIVPGVVNMQKQLQKNQNEERTIQVKAVIVIQKWTRGMLARAHTRKIRDRRQRDIEAQYGYFEDQVKFGSEYNLKKFLREKERMRERNKTNPKLMNSAALVESDSIMEKIGDSSSLGSRIPIIMKSGVAMSQSLGRKVESKAKIQNYFPKDQTRIVERDNLSIINIMFRQSMPKLGAVQSPVKLDTKISPKKPSTKKQQELPLKKQRKHSNSEIEEDIIDEQIEGEEPIIVGKKNQTNIDGSSSITEDIILSGSHKQSSESTSKELRPFQQLRSHQPFANKQHSSIGESIQEEIMFSAEKRSPNKKGHSYERQSNSSIAEDSNLQHAEASRGSSGKIKTSGGIEDSIPESLIDEEEGLNSGSSNSALITKNKKIEAANRDRLRREHESDKEKTNRQIEEFKQNLENDKLKRDKQVGELLNELNRYESSTVSTLVLERMEKVISKSLAQKDQLFLAQRLHELDLEKRHKEEIARIREEQIKLLYQLLMAGSAGAGGLGSALSEKEKKDLIDNFQKIMEKPIIIQEESKQHSISMGRKPSHTSKVLSKISESSIKESMNFNQKNDQEEENDDSIIDEVEDSLNKREEQSSSGDNIKESLPTNQDDSTSMHLANLRHNFGSEAAIRQQSKQAVSQGHGKVTKLTGGPFNQNSFKQLQEEQFKQIVTTGAHDSIIQKVEHQIEAYRIQGLKDLENELHRNLITPRSHHRKGVELERWANAKKIELSKKVEPINYQYQSIVDGLKQEKDKILLKIGLSPRRDNYMDVGNSTTFKESQSLSYRDIEDDLSGESDRTKNVRDQISRIAQKRQDLLLLSANSQFDPTESAISQKEDLKIKKKKALAKKLVEEKEKMIREGMKAKLRDMEAVQAEKMLAVAMNMDPEKEIEKRVENLKRRQLMIETSGEIEESARSQSQGVTASMASGKIDESTRSDKKSNRKVHFTGVKTTSPDRNSTPRQQKQAKLEESIGEDLPSGDESMSESIPASAAASSNQSGKRSLPSQGSNEKKSQSNNSQRSEESQYSEDFIEQSLPESSRKSTPGKKLSSHQHTLPDDESQIEEEDYSQRFDASQSNQNNPAIIVSQPSEEKTGSSQEKSGSEETIKQTVSWKESSQPTTDNVGDNQEDKEIVDSSKSIDWQINLIQKKQKEASPVAEPSEQSEEKQKEKSSSETEPDFLDQVEMMVDEFMEIMIKDAQDDPDLVFDKPIDEDQFKEKFPFNLKKEEPEPVITRSPSTIPSARSNDPPAKSQEQLAREKYDEESKHLKERYQRQVQYIELVIENIDKEELIEQLEKPLDTDPLKKLADIFSQEADDSHIQHNETLNPSTLLSLDFFRKMERKYESLYEEEIQNIDSQNPSTTYHHKALFDALNAVLDNERPYREKGQPFPWSKQTRVVRKKIGNAELEKILLKSKTKVLDMCKTNAGTNINPPPALPPANPDDPQASMQVSPQVFEQQQKDRLTALKEERLGLLMVRDLEENEHTWIDYEDADTTVKFDLADMILDVLNNEVAQFLFGKKYS